MRLINVARIIGLLIAPYCTGMAQPARRWVDQSWRETARFEDPQGHALVHPQKLVACGQQVVLLDLDGNSIVALDSTLRLRWRFGRVGSGPGEFRMPSDIACDHVGNAWVADPGNSRIGIIGPNGVFARHVSVEQRLHRVAVSQTGRDIFVTGGGPDLASMLASDGRVARKLALPQALRDFVPLQREGYVASLQSGGFGMAFRWAGAVMMTEPAGDAPTLVAGIEPIAFPQVRAYPTGSGRTTMVRIEPGATRGARAVFSQGDTLYVLFAGAAPGLGTIVDRYAYPGARYLDSWRLPLPAESMVMRGNVAYVLVTEPLPAVIQLERSARR